ncbi:putative membrane protein YeiB [Rhodococcus sp. UYP5]
MSGFSAESAAAGLAIAGVYFPMASLLMTTRASRMLVGAVAPLRRMSLTSYVSAAPLMLAAGRLLSFDQNAS